MSGNFMKVISPYEVENLIKNSENISIIDVRETFEVQRGMISGAMHIPLGKLQTSLHHLEKEKKYVVVCETGSRSRMATYLLNSLGYDA